MQTDYLDFLIDAVPGARELADEIEKLSADMKPFNDAVGAAIAARVAKTRGGLRPAAGVTTAEVEALGHAKDAAVAAQTAHGSKIRAARKKFDDLMRSLSRDERRTIAGPVEAKAREDAADALAKLESALSLVNEAGQHSAPVDVTVARRSFSLQPAPDGYGFADTPVRALGVLRAHLEQTERVA